MLLTVYHHPIVPWITQYRDVILPLSSSSKVQYEHRNLVDCLVRASGLDTSSEDTRVWVKLINYLAKGRDAIYAYERYRNTRFVPEDWLAFRSDDIVATNDQR
jgi:hypothetical protein